MGLESVALILAGFVVLVLTWAVLRLSVAVTEQLAVRDKLITNLADKALATDENQRAIAYARMNAEAEAAKSRPPQPEPMSGDGSTVHRFGETGMGDTIG